MLKLTTASLLLTGPAGQLSGPRHDPILPKLAMLYEGECEGLGPCAAARKFGYSKQRYFQLREAFAHGGTLALQNQKRGPKTQYRRTEQIIQQVVRFRFLDPDASAAVVAQKLRQSGHAISTRSVERVIASFGLQKKTPPLSSGTAAGARRDASQQAVPAPRARRPRKPRAGGASTARR